MLALVILHRRESDVEQDELDEDGAHSSGERRASGRTLSFQACALMASTQSHPTSLHAVAVNWQKKYRFESDTWLAK